MKEKWKRLLALILCCGMLGVAPGMAEEMDAMLSRGQQYEEAGEYQKALASYELASRIDPNAEAPYLAIARLHLTLEEEEEALEAVDSLLAIAPASGKAWLLKMDIHLQLLNPEEAEADALYAEVCGEEIPRELLVRLGMEWLYLKSDEAKSAAAFERAAQLGTTLDAAFEKGTLSLTEVSVWPEELSGYEVGMPMVLWESMAQETKDQLSAVHEDAENGLMYGALPEEEMRYFRENALPVSIAPDGDVVLFRLGKVFYALRGKKLITLAKAANRGAADEYGKLDYYINSYAKHLPGEEGAVWSPDGRYAVMTACWAFDTIMRTLDPVILDTWRGEIFLAAAYPDSLSDGGADAIQAQFDQSGRYLYYILIGKAYEKIVALMRYDLETGENIMCCNDAELISCPSLWELADGRLINLKAATGVGKTYCGLNVYTLANGKWTNDSRNFSVVSKTVYPFFLQYSNLSGEALVLAQLLGPTGHCMIRVRPEADFEGMDTYWAIEDLSAAAASQIDPVIFAEENIETSLEKVEKDYAKIYHIQLSPDGKYALLYASKNSTDAFLLLRLSDMALCQVDAPEELLTTTLMKVWNNGVYNPGFTWEADGRLLILGTSSVKAYQLQ